MIAPSDTLALDAVLFDYASLVHDVLVNPLSHQKKSFQLGITSKTLYYGTLQLATSVENIEHIQYNNNT